jgi:2-polyprenyl-3-methyl-5-hydroxy-6-metoxy-1,4-benzoquinol methylase
MVFTGTEPTIEELQRYYADYPVHDNVSPVTIKRYDELLDRFEAYRTNNRIIDVGCGAGIFLERAALRGWEVHGTEYGERALKACRSRGIAIIEGPLEPANYGPDHFDVVCSFEVMEHVPHPRSDLERMARILRPGGLLYVTTPNYTCVGHALAGSGWSVVNYPEHLNYFTPRTLRRMAKAFGLEATWIRTTGVSTLRVRARLSQGREEKQALLASQEQLRERLEGDRFLNFLKRTADNTLSFLRVGDSLKGGFVKKVQ